MWFVDGEKKRIKRFLICIFVYMTDTGENENSLDVEEVKNLVVREFNDIVVLS